jgi:multidrug transporter EmrE-like cation transporter
VRSCIKAILLSGHSCPHSSGVHIRLVPNLFTTCVQTCAHVHPDTSPHSCIAGMMSCFTRALQTLSATTATALSTTSNVLLSGEASAAVFHDRVGTRWVLGAALLICGTALLTAASATAATHEHTSAASSARGKAA